MVLKVWCEFEQSFEQPCCNVWVSSIWVSDFDLHLQVNLILAFIIRKWGKGLMDEDKRNYSSLNFGGLFYCLYFFSSFMKSIVLN
jgi:hypothetical protein